MVFWVLSKILAPNYVQRASFLNHLSSLCTNPRLSCFSIYKQNTFAENRKARFDYQILETYEAGIELKGFEVKAIKTGRANLTGSYALIRDERAVLINADIPPYQPANTPDGYDPKRTRRLLLNKKEIGELMGKTHKTHCLKIVIMIKSPLLFIHQNF